MKKLFKKIAAIVMVAVIAVSAMVIPTTTASAANIFDGAIKISELEYYSTNFSAAKEYQYYKIVLPSNGDITLRVTETDYWCTTDWLFYDSNATAIEGGYFGSGKSYTIENLNAGTYYLYVVADSDGSFVKDFYYTFTPDNKPTLAFKMTLKKGDTLQLGALTTNYDGKVKWTSTKKSVATVSSTGKITAKKKGTTTIRAELDNGMYIQIKLTVKKK